MPTDYYEIFGVAPDADIETIKQRYRILVRENHPDVSTNEDAHARMQQILEAWSVLSTPAARTSYDLSRREAAKRNATPTSGAAKPSSPARNGGARTQPGSARPRVDVNPRSSNPRTRLLTMVFEAAQMYSKDGLADEAISLCNKVLKADPKSSEAADLLGDIYAGQGRNDLALLMYKRAMQNQPNMLLYRQKWEALQQKVAPQTSTEPAVPASRPDPLRPAAPPPNSTAPPAAATTSPSPASRAKSAGCGAAVALVLGTTGSCLAWLVRQLASAS